MAQTSRRFNEGEDAFWDHVDEVLAENELAMQRIIRRPGEIGAVAVRLTQAALPELELPDPPEAA